MPWWSLWNKACFQNYFPYRDLYHIPCISHKLCILVLLLHEISWPQATWGPQGLFWLHFHITVHYQRKSGPELIKHGKSREEEPVQRPWRVLLSLLSYSTWGPTAQGWHRPQWTEQSVSALQACLQPDLMMAIDQLRVPPLRGLYLWVVGIKLTQTPVIPKRWSLTGSSSRRDRGSPLGGFVCIRRWDVRLNTKFTPASHTLHTLSVKVVPMAFLIA